MFRGVGSGVGFRIPCSGWRLGLRFAALAPLQLRAICGLQRREGGRGGRGELELSEVDGRDAVSCIALRAVRSLLSGE